MQQQGITGHRGEAMCIGQTIDRLHVHINQQDRQLCMTILHTNLSYCYAQTSLHYLIYSTTKLCIHVFTNLKDNLQTKDTSAVAKVFFLWRFHCTHVIMNARNLDTFSKASTDLRLLFCAHPCCFTMNK